MVNFFINYLKGFKNFYSYKNNKVLITIVVFLVSIIALIFNYSLKVSEKALSEQMLHREQLVARSGVRPLESFIELIGTQVSSFSTRSSIITPDENTEKILESFISSYSKYPIGGIILIDKNGIITYAANKEGIPINETNLSEREYFLDLKENYNKEFNISKPLISKFGASKGEYSVIVSAPIIRGGEFAGIVSVSVILSELVNDYLSPLKLTDNTIISLAGLDSILFSSSDEKIIDLDYSKFDYMKNNEWKTVTDEGILTATSSFKIRSGDVWFIAVGTPLENALEFIDPFSRTYFIFLLSGIVIILIFSMYILDITGKYRKK